MKHTLAFSLGLALLGTTLGTAQAQRAPISREDRRAQRQQAMQNMTPEQRQQFIQNQRQQRGAASTARGGNQTGGNGQNWGNAGAGVNGGVNTGAGGNGVGGTGGGRRSRNGGNGGTAASTDASHEARMRALMNAAGITDKAQQDPIVAFVLAEEKARKPLLKTAQDVAASLRDGKSTPDQVKAKWATYQTTLDTDKARYKQDLAALDTKIGWSKDPRLESFLTLVGIVTPDSLSIGGVQAIFVDAPTTNAPTSPPMNNATPSTPTTAPSTTKTPTDTTTTPPPLNPAPVHTPISTPIGSIPMPMLAG